MNSTDLGDVAAASGYAMPTENIPWSSASGRLDHIYMKGLRPIDAGTEDVPPAVSDHRPIWATAISVP